MGKTGFLLSGQGAQQPGMGCALCAAHPAAKEIFTMADATLGYAVSDLCFHGSQEQLNQTIYTQPCVLTCDLAAARALLARGIACDGCAGFSLGEFAGLAVAGVFSDQVALGLIAKRAAYMQEACDATSGSMVAVIGGDPALVEELCARVENVWAVNFNCPGQIVVAGQSDALVVFTEIALAQKLRIMPLKVSGGFHSPLMQSAMPKLRSDLQTTPWSAPTCPVYANTTAMPYPSDVGIAKDQLAHQLMEPVLWEATIRNMVADGFDRLIECGHGNTLVGFVKRMKLPVEILSYEDLLI